MRVARCASGRRARGACPGPACYGRGGTKPTVTDANLVLGYMDPARFLGGTMKLDRDAALRAMEEHLAKPLGISPTDAAIGIFRIANNDMSNALRYISVSRGRDPRDYTLIAFGGAGPIHAGVQAIDIGIKAILVPRRAAVLSAFGGLVADFKVSRIQSFVCSSTAVNLDKLNALFLKMQVEAEKLLPKSDDMRVDRYIDLRYEGQVNEVIVPVHTRTRRITEVKLARAVRDFHDMHQQLYAHKRPDQPVQIISLRLELIGAREALVEPAQKFDMEEDPAQALIGTREVYFEKLGFVEAPIYDGRLIRPGNLVVGPAVIHEPDTTIVVYNGQEVTLDQYETYVIEIVNE